jgi:hypothetical protein
MKLSGLFQTVILLLLLALAASCSVSQQYVQKLQPVTAPIPTGKSQPVFLSISPSDSSVNNPEVNDPEFSRQTDKSTIPEALEKPTLPKTTGKRMKRMREE